MFLNTILKNKAIIIFDKIGIRSDRTKNITKQVVLSFLYKLGSMICTFLLIPITINYLDSESYGVWLTLTSFISWFSFFDIGLGNGLRNKFAEAKAKGDYSLARGYISSAYFTISSIGLGLIIVFYGINSYIDWSVFFNTSESLKQDLKTLMPFIFGFFVLQMVVNLITTIYTADQRNSEHGKINFLTQLGSISLIYILTQNVKPSLLTYGIVFASFPVILLFLFNIFAFKTRYKNLKPTIKKWKLKYLKDIFGLGLNFFIIQISAIVLFATDNFIITHLFGPREVLPYNISFKYFSTLTMIYSILTTPYWSSFTDAYTKKDFVWIKKTVKTVNIIWLFFLFIIVLMLLCSNFVYKLWIGEKAQITFELSMSMALFSAIITYSSIYVNFLNGVGKIRIQVITSIVSMIINIPLSVFFVKTMGLGLSGIILATCLSLGYSVILLPIQYHKIINGTDKGIWAR